MLSLLPAGILAVASGVAADAAVNPRVVSFDIARGGVSPRDPSPYLSKRATVTEGILNNITGGGYYATVSIGTPGQSQPLVLDTGSSDAWIVSKSADLCGSKTLQNENNDGCIATYDKSQSSSYKLVETGGFSIQYLDGTTSQGDYISDNFALGGTTVKSLQMGLATEIVRGVGILGIGFSVAESTTSTYPNLVDQLVSQSLIPRAAYSLYLDDVRTNAGSILFGGVDTAKFIGSLNYLPLLRSSASATSTNLTYTTFAVTLTGLSTDLGNGTTATVSGLSTTNALPAILDSGTTLSYFPDTYAQRLFKAVGAYTDDVETGLTFIPCAYKTDLPNMVVTYKFGPSSSTQKGTASIAVPIAQLAINPSADGTDVSSQLPAGIPFSNPCVFGIQSEGSLAKRSTETEAEDDDDDNELSKRTTHPFIGLPKDNVLATTSSYALLGDTFLRSAYVLYDLAGKQVGMAQSNLNTTDSSVTELPGSSATALPTLVGVASQQTTATGVAAGASSTDASSSGGGGGSTGTSKAAAAGVRPPSLTGAFVGVGLSVLFAMVGGAVFAL